MADHLRAFRKQFSLDSELNLGTIRIAVNAVYDAQAIGFSFLSDV
jgi:hypothetical protein